MRSVPCHLNAMTFCTEVVQCQPTSVLPATGPCITHQSVCLRCVALLNVAIFQNSFDAFLEGIAWLPGSWPPFQQCGGVLRKHS